MNFGSTPDKTVELRVLYRHVDPSEKNPLRLNSESFPNCGGVYVIRFKQKQIPRLIGESPILRIGYTKDYSDRIRSYASRDIVYDLGSPLSEMLGGEDKAANTTAYVLFKMLKPDEGGDSIVVDLHYQASERKFLYQYVCDHLETPPLNFSLRADN